MNESEMGLIEESNYADDVMTSTLYVASAGAKDVGSYRCSGQTVSMFILSAITVVTR